MCSETETGYFPTEPLPLISVVLELATHCHELDLPVVLSSARHSHYVQLRAKENGRVRKAKI